MEGKNLNSNIFDLIYIGTGPVILLDAINEHLKGKKVLVLDSSSNIGGAWKSLNIFNINGLENAVHYLLPNKNGYEFLEKFLGVKLKTCKKLFAIKLINIFVLFKSNSVLGKFVSLLYKDFNLKSWESIRNSFFSKSTSMSKYPVGGSQEIINKIKNLIKAFNLNIKLGNNVENILITDTQINLKTDKGNFFAKKIVVSHGFIPPKKFYINSDKIIINKKVYRRPSLHIIYKSKPNKYKKKFSQIIFKQTHLIKYVHELTQFKDKKEIEDSMTVIVCALNHSLKNEPKTIRKIITELENFNIIHGEEERLNTNFFWQEINLPLIDNEDLKYLKKISNGKILTLETEELCTSIGKNSSNWSKLKSFL